MNNVTIKLKFSTLVLAGVAIKCGFELFDHVVKPFAIGVESSAFYELWTRNEKFRNWFDETSRISRENKATIRAFIIREDIRRGKALRFEMVTYKTKRDADAALKLITNILNEKGSLTMRDVSSIITTDSNKKPNSIKHGWKKGAFDSVVIFKNDGAWTFVLPPAYEL